jgi:hypothetical protein
MQLKTVNRRLWPSSQSQIYVSIDGQSVSWSWCQAPSWARDQIFITVTRLRICWSRAPSLTRGRVCRLRPLLALASAVILGSESRDNTTIFYCLRFETSGVPGLRVYIPQEQDGSVIPSGTWFPFVSSYDSQGYGGCIRTRRPKSKSKLLYDWRFTAN